MTTGKLQSHFVAEKRYVTEIELSKIITKSRQGLQLDRYKGVGLPYIRLGRRRIVYDLKAAEKYMQENTITPKNN